MSRYFFRLLVIVCTGASSICFAQADSVVGKQLRVSFDISRPVMNFINTNRYSYELQADYYLRNEVYLDVEGGWGASEINYPDLQYKSNNSFARLGIDKVLLPRMFPGDWDVIFIGLRYGIGFINRGEAIYTTSDDFWGTTTGTIPAADITAHWAEITAGMKVELLRDFFAGWNLRGKFLLNPKAFRELSPAYVAGYGRGDKTSAFDFNIYLSYAIRWDRK